MQFQNADHLPGFELMYAMTWTTLGLMVVGAPLGAWLLSKNKRATSIVGAFLCGLAILSLFAIIPLSINSSSEPDKATQAALKSNIEKKYDVRTHGWLGSKEGRYTSPDSRHRISLTLPDGRNATYLVQYAWETNDEPTLFYYNENPDVEIPRPEELERNR